MLSGNIGGIWDVGIGYFNLSLAVNVNVNICIQSSKLTDGYRIYIIGCDIGHMQRGDHRSSKNNLSGECVVKLNVEPQSTYGAVLI